MYLRRVEDRIFTLILASGEVRDAETGTTWAMETGVALDGPLQGRTLRSVPYIPAFDSAWRDFYPQSRWHGQE